jgi:hypothetical protein
VPASEADFRRFVELSATEFAPKVLARFTSETGPPFLVERRIGRGRVLLATSGILSSWNTLPKTNAIVIFDRILRGMIQATLPMRNYTGVDRIGAPVPDEFRDARIVLQRPGKGVPEETLDIGFLRQDQMGVTIDRPLTRGFYRLRVDPTEGSTGEGAVASATVAAGAAGPGEKRPSWQFDVAVNGEAEESDLEPLARATFDQSAANSRWRWVSANEEISLAGAVIRGQDLWWWFALLVFAVLLGELVVLAWPGWRIGSVSGAAGGT